MRNKLFPALLMLVVVAGCDLVGGSGSASSRQYVVESYLRAGGKWQPVRVSRTTAVQDTFSFSKLAVTGADVRVEKLDETGNVMATYPYRARGRELSPGVYDPVQPVAPVEPLGTYRLRVEVPQAEGGPHTITATTTVPDTFSVKRLSADSVTYQGEEQIRFTITQSRYPRRQSRYVFSSKALGVLYRKRLTPLFQQFLGDEDDDLNLNTIRQNTSPVLNESNYKVNPNGTFTVAVPWLVFVFYGPNQLSARALDDNMYDYLRSYSAQQGSATLAPGELPNVIDHVEGGTGLFGSYARVGRRVAIERPPPEDSSR